MSVFYSDKYFEEKTRRVDQRIYFCQLMKLFGSITSFIHWGGRPTGNMLVPCVRQHLKTGWNQTCCFFVLFAWRWAAQKHFFESSRPVKHLQQVSLQHSSIISGKGVEMYFSDSSICRVSGFSQNLVGSQVWNYSEIFIELTMKQHFQLKISKC